ncbi:MAG: barnase inhibitor [Deltaproteobacteria bacterium HGW-Deltaproteobacteria-6]|jgi:ribonuclease inhibitor|nr:MAG: barnase inhibitor [Deltaproteobacteria bacterium HGW-Deltaproteobacteria-6]
MPVKRCTLNGLAIRSLDDLYEQLAFALPLPRHFGRNLDALWDILSTDLQGPFEIIWKNADESKKWMGRDYGRIMKLLRSLKKERNDFQLTIEP